MSGSESSLCNTWRSHEVSHLGTEQDADACCHSIRNNRKTLTAPSHPVASVSFLRQNCDEVALYARTPRIE